MRNFLQNSLQRSWNGRGLLSFLMLPLSALYGVLVYVRRQLYARGWMAAHRARAMVIVVGNVVAGGAGKTPTVIALVQHLMHRGYRVGVVSRGYGRAGTDTRGVERGCDPHDVGDEPLLVHHRTGAPVWVGRTRAQAVDALLSHHPQTQIVVCDDGLQHYALARDLELCVFDDRGIGNGRLLPAGPLREPWPRHLVAACGQRPDRTLVLNTGSRPAIAGYRTLRRLEPYAVNARQERVDLAGLQPSGALPLLALAGIAQPQAFFRMLATNGLTVARTLALPDHFDFDSIDCNIFKSYQVICTEKDAVKLWQHVPQALAIPLVQEFEPELLEALNQQVQQFFSAKL